MNPLDISLAAGRFGQTPPQQRFAYHANGQIEFHGIGKRGTADSAAAWYVTKSTFNGNNQVTDIKVAPQQSVWDDRATLVFA